MTSQLKVTQAAEEALIAAFFQQSAGLWRSERRYYTLPNGGTKEMISLITIRFLEQGCTELQQLAQLHKLDSSNALACGAEVAWESTDISGHEENAQSSLSDSPAIPRTQKQSKGLTLFGVWGKTLYRDRGFATSKPVTAQYYFPNPQTMCLRTEYNGSVFEEELKLIGNNYRTRQTIISRAGEQLMIGQYLEKRIADC